MVGPAQRAAVRNSSMGDFETRYQDGEYLDRTSDWHEEDAAWKATQVHELLRGAGLEPRRIADVGCGTGGVLVQLQAMLPPGTDFTGFEIAAPAFEIARRRGNAHLQFVQGSPIDAPGERFDIALALDVFEHVPDYLGFLRSLRQVAHRFVFHIPLDLSVRSLLTDLPMHRRRSVGHLHYFSSATARATLEDCGYRIVAERHTHAIMQPPPPNWRWQLRRMPDRLLFRVNPGLCEKLLGGCSLLVLAEPA
jgi:SAM-dependent methyltransferase